MNADEANRIPLAQILDLTGVAPGKRIGQEMAYLAPWRDERTPSLHVNPAKNLWFDFGEGKGGSVITFVCTYLERSGEPHTVADALRWVANMAGQRPRLAPVHEPAQTSAETPKLSLIKTVPLRHPALLDYLATRHIPHFLARRYLAEAWLYNRTTKKHSFALAFANEDGGCELRNPFMKISLKKKAITFIRGSIPKPNGIHFFEGFIDFLSALAFYKTDSFRDDAIIFNSLALMDQATPLLRGYGYHTACTWLDNDAAGNRATEAFAVFCKTEQGLCHRPMNALYSPHKDVNAWHVAQFNPKP